MHTHEGLPRGGATMNFSTLSDCHKNWLDILVIGKA
jgi:hypothetical protein